MTLQVSKMSIKRLLVCIAEVCNQKAISRVPEMVLSRGFNPLVTSVRLVNYGSVFMAMGKPFKNHFRPLQLPSQKQRLSLVWIRL
jgi:hypothetical protein